MPKGSYISYRESFVPKFLTFCASAAASSSSSAGVSVVGHEWQNLAKSPLAVSDAAASTSACDSAYKG